MKSLPAFLDSAVTPFHAVSEVKSILEENGFAALSEREAFKIKKGGKYYVTRNSSSLIAFAVPDREANYFKMASAHTDFPTFRVKETVDSATHYTRLGVERYGGTLSTTWFDRPLSVAGRIFARVDGAVKEYLVDMQKEQVVIPSLAIHLNRDANTKAPLVDPKCDMLPLVSDTEDTAFFEKVYASACVCAADVISSELFLYASAPAFVWSDRRLITSARLDDLMCVYGLLAGFVRAEHKGAVSVLALFDNEEIGSTTKQGADSSFLSDTLERITEALGKSSAEHKQMLANSFMISADNAHAVHPNHPELADKEGGRVYMNEGIVIKHSSNAKYTTDACSEALLISLCEATGIPYQKYYNRADLLGGSTLGNISCSHVSVPSVDIGLAQLAMHSSTETAGMLDIEHLISLSGHYYASELLFEDDAWKWIN